MKLKEFSITRYGPLPDTGRVSLSARNFNLFWGKNEDGKTLTIDALVKLLLGRNVKDFKDIDRVDEKPEGYVILEDEREKEVKLPEKGDLTKIVEGLTSSQCRNVFVVRNSDLSIAYEGEFYTDVTDRLTGLRTGEILEVKEALREIGKMTPGGVFRDIKDERLKTRVEKAAELVRAIESLLEKVKEGRFDEFEEESVRLGEDTERLRQDIANLEDARRREQYEKGKDALDKLIDAVENVKGLEIYNQSDWQLWRDCEKDIEDHRRQSNELVVNLGNTKRELQSTAEALRKGEEEFRILEERKRRLDDEVKPDLKSYEIELGKVKSQETKNRFYAIAAITSAVLSAVSILAVVLNPSTAVYGLLAFFVGATAAFAMLRLSFTQKKAHLAGVFERIKLSVTRFELGAESPEKLYSNVQRFEEEYGRKSEELQRVRNSEEKSKERIHELQNTQIPKIQDRIKGAEEKIQRIKTKSKEESLEQYAEKFERKGKLESLIRQKESVLKSHFGEKSGKLEANIPHWTAKVGNLEEYKEKAKDVKYSEADASRLDQERREREESLEGVKEKIHPLRDEMTKVERDANDILKSDEPLYCETSVDLKAIRDRLQSFIEENENNKDNALTATEIFEEIEKEEREKVSQLFGSDSPISEYFNEMTNGLYEAVLFDQETAKIWVKRRDGEILAAEKLSGGAHDQLYLCIRLALGERLLKGRKGFFILDDPFIKADPARLQRQIQTLRKISELGWQVIYFSAKGEIKDALKEDIEAGTINYVEVQGIFS